MTDEKRRKVDQHICYTMEQWRKIGSFGIMINISKYVTWAQLMDSVSYVNNAVILVVKWIFDSNYEKSFPLNIDELNLVVLFLTNMIIVINYKLCIIKWGM